VAAVVLNEVLAKDLTFLLHIKCL